MSESAKPNRLAGETSPYLLQHQFNPVDWHPWGPAAFELARHQNKPIFLSVGYSTCYWCHVMERQCFEDAAIAEVMNQTCINIKVDREERPDVDQLYMNAVQILTRQGGWPMSVFLTPGLLPFYGGTYFPPVDSHGRPGLVTLLRAIQDAWKNRRIEIDNQAAEMKAMLEALARPRQVSTSVALDRPLLDKLILRAADDYEPRFGGFGDAPKFPRQTLLRLLLTWLESADASDARERDTREWIVRQLTHTLTAMADGGIRDHLGGGFHRYSTDARWLVPHFEIMLYDQAMLAAVYARAARILDTPRFASVARGICDFVLRELTAVTGVFFTAIDAEVDAYEGQNYLWTREQIVAVLGESPDTDHFCKLYGLDAGSNFTDPHQHDAEPANILFLPAGSAGEDERAVVAARAKLLAHRATRKQPLTDTKVLTSWNAMMIEALAVCGRELQEPIYRDAAARAADAILRTHQTPDGRLVRTSRDGTTKHDACLDDYAFLAAALLELHASTRDVRWRHEAERITVKMLSRFGEPGAVGAFATPAALFFTAGDARDLIVRQKVASDSPLPSGNAAAALVLMELGQHESARNIITEFSGQLGEFSASMSSLLEAALLLSLGPAFDARIDSAPIDTEPPHDHVVTLIATRVNDHRIDVVAKIAAGYHLYDTTTDPRLGLIATRLRVGGGWADRVDFIDYPPGRVLNLSYGPPVSGYTGSIEISVRFTRPLPGSPIDLSLSYQACGDVACLRPGVARVRA